MKQQRPAIRGSAEDETALAWMMLLLLRAAAIRRSSAWRRMPLVRPKGFRPFLTSAAPRRRGTRGTAGRATAPSAPLPVALVKTRPVEGGHRWDPTHDHQWHEEESRTRG